MKLIKIPFMIIGFIIVTFATMFIMLIDWLLRATFGEDY